MNIEMKIEDGLVKVYNANNLVASEQSKESENIYTYKEFEKLHERVKNAQYDNMRKAGRTEEEIKSSVQVLVFAPGRAGQYLAVTQKDVIPALLKLKEDRRKIEAAQKEKSEDVESRVGRQVAESKESPGGVRPGNDYRVGSDGKQRSASPLGAWASGEQRGRNGDFVRPPEAHQSGARAGLCDVHGRDVSGGVV